MAVMVGMREKKIVGCYSFFILLTLSKRLDGGCKPNSWDDSSHKRSFIPQANPAFSKEMFSLFQIRNQFRNCEKIFLEIIGNVLELQDFLGCASLRPLTSSSTTPYFSSPHHPMKKRISSYCILQTPNSWDDRQKSRMNHPTSRGVDHSGGAAIVTL